MRQIKFRAWDKSCDVMLVPEDANAWVMHCNGCSAINGVWATDDLELMQFTGLQDSKGVDIYEGDIVEHSDTKGFPSLSIGAIEWDEYRAQFNHSRYSEEYLSGKVLTVIGNIYENGDLLNDN